MTRKTCGDDKAFKWKDERFVYVISYIDPSKSKTEKVVTVFNNIMEAKTFYVHCMRNFKHVQFDTCRVYDRYDAFSLIFKGLGNGE